MFIYILTSLRCNDQSIERRFRKKVKVRQMDDYKMNFTFFTPAGEALMKSVLLDEDRIIGRCTVSASQGIWTISAWYVDEEYQNRGLGRKLLFNTCENLEKKVGEPMEIQYNWNGTNDYVFNWLSENFSPLSMCPMSVLKYEDIYPEDIPSGHLYKLKKEQFVKYWKEIIK